MSTMIETTECAADDCVKSVYARRVCHRHYLKLLYYVDGCKRVEAGDTQFLDALEAFQSTEGRGSGWQGW